MEVKENDYKQEEINVALLAACRSACQTLLNLATCGWLQGDAKQIAMNAGLHLGQVIDEVEKRDK